MTGAAIMMIGGMAIALAGGAVYGVVDRHAGEEARLAR